VVILEPNKMLTIENKKDGEQIDSLVLKTWTF
jgi:hypothetical protein